MIFFKNAGALIASSVLFFSATTGLAASSCKSSFLKFNNYDQIEVFHSKAVKEGLVVYTVQMYGRNNAFVLRPTSEILGSVSYTLRDQSLRIHRVLDRPELEGGNIFSTLLENVLVTNPQVDQISMNVGQSHVSVAQMEQLVQTKTLADIDSSFSKILQMNGLSIERAQMIPLMDQYSLVLVLRRNP